MPTPNTSSSNAVDLGIAFDLPPEEAIRYFESKGYAIGFNWYDVEAKAHARAFTVAGILKQDVLIDIKTAFEETLKNGGTQRDFENLIKPVLEKKGWLGNKLVADEDGVLQGKQLTPRRFETIFRTNMQSAYNAGRYEQQMQNVEHRPYFERVSVMDTRVRPSHAAMHGFIARYDDPIWQTMYPPDAYNCRCRVRTRSQADVDKYDLPVQDTSEGERLVEIEKPVAQTGEMRTMTAFKNPKNGQLFSPDVGFEFNPGKESLAALGQRLLERTAQAEPRLASIAVNEVFSNPMLNNAVKSDVKKFVSEFFVDRMHKGLLRHVGVLPTEVIEKLQKKGHQIPAGITLTHANLGHATRYKKESPLPDEFWLNIVEMLRTPTAIIYDTFKKEPSLTYFYKLPEGNMKLVILIEHSDKVRNPLTNKKERIDMNYIRTGKVLETKGKNPYDDTQHYEVLWGSVDDY